jgi:hypothetical protein
MRIERRIMLRGVARLYAIVSRSFEAPYSNFATTATL